MNELNIVSATEIIYAEALKNDLVKLYLEKRIYEYISKEASDKYANGNVDLLAENFIKSSAEKFKSGSEYHYYVLKAQKLIGLIGFDRREGNILELWFLKTEYEKPFMAYILPELLSKYCEANEIIATSNVLNERSIELLKNMNFVEKSTNGKEKVFAFVKFQPVRFVAFATKGLLDISQRELSQLSGYKYISNDDKHIYFVAYFIPKQLEKLLTVDDIAIVVEENNFQEIINLISKFRALTGDFSITISSYKSSREKQEEVIQKVKKIFIEELGMSYTEGDHSNLDVRLIFENDKVEVALKVFSTSLYNRKYNHESDIGALRSTIAASMIMYIKDKCNGDVLLDPFCGTGTFLCEGVAQRLQVYGSDIDENKIEISRRNLKKLGIEPHVTITNAENLSGMRQNINMIVTNVPWGKQIKTQFSVKKVVDEFKRTLAKDGCIAILTVEPMKWTSAIRRIFLNYEIESRKIGYIGQTPTVLFCTPKK